MYTSSRKTDVKIKKYGRVNQKPNAWPTYRFTLLCPLRRMGEDKFIISPLIEAFSKNMLCVSVAHSYSKPRASCRIHQFPLCRQRERSVPGRSPLLPQRCNRLSFTDAFWVRQPDLVPCNQVRRVASSLEQHHSGSWKACASSPSNNSPGNEKGIDRRNLLRSRCPPSHCYLFGRCCRMGTKQYMYIDYVSYVCIYEYHTKLANMSFDKIFDVTAGVFFHSNMMYDDLLP